MNQVVVGLLTLCGVVVTGAAAYAVATRRHSGKIGTTEAETLWAESQAMRKELRDEADICRREVAALREEMVAVRAEGVAMREELVALRQEGIVLRAESVSLREEMVTLREESVLLRKVDLKERLEERLADGRPVEEDNRP